MKTKQKIIVHLKHPTTPKIELYDPIDPTSWYRIAKHKTLCWTSITKNMKVTDDISKVTCKKCQKIYKLDIRDNK